MDWWAYVSVFLIASIKFLFSIPFTVRFSPLMTFLIPVTGSITGMVIFTYSGNRIMEWWSRRFGKKKPTSFSRRRKILYYWRKFGLYGAAVILPFISPPVGVAIATAFRESPLRIILTYSVSLIIWGALFTYFKESLITLLG